MIGRKYKMAFKFQKHLRNYVYPTRLVSRDSEKNQVYLFDSFSKNITYINFVPMEFDEKKIIFMKLGRSAGTAIWRHTLEPYVYSRNGWTGNQTCTNKDERSKNWLNSVTDDELKNEYFVFIFVRNPFARVVSCWGEGNRSTQGMKCSPDFDYFIKNELWRDDTEEFNGYHDQHYIPASIYSEYDDGDMFIDWYGKIENIQEDWKTLCEKISKPYSVLPNVKSGHTVKHNYKHYYTDELIEIVAKHYKRDLELFDYDF
jgi:hypothetical protein